MSDGPPPTPWPGGYRCLGRQRFEADGYELRPIAWDDIETIRQWRNGQIEVLRQADPLTPADQARYFDEVVRPQMDEDRPDQVLVAFLHDGVLIGYGGLVHIDWANDRGEMSFLVAPERARGSSYAAEYGAFLGLLRQVAADTGLHRLTTETFEFRHESIAILEAQGFVLEGRLRQHQRHGDVYVDSVLHGLLLHDPPRGAVLVTSAAGKVPLLRAVERAAARTSPPTAVIAGDIDPAALTARVATRWWTMPPTTDESLPALIDGLVERNVTAVIPTRDGELAFFARHADELRQRGIAVMVSPLAAVEACLDKVEFAHAGAAAGLPVIPTALTLDPAVLGPGPYVVKERRGAGSKSLGLGLDAPAAEAWASGLDEPVFQPVVEGPEISIDLYVTAAGEWVGAVPRTRDEVVAGESRVTTTIDDPEAVALGRSVAEALGLRGHAVVQAIRGPDGYRLVECNCRVGGASTLAFAAGLDSLRWFLLEAAGEPLPSPTFVAPAGPLRLVRVPSDVIT